VEHEAPANQSGPAQPESIERLAGALASLGAETETERAVKRIAPWVVSVAIHAAVVALGFMVTWTMVRLGEDEQPVLIVADFDAPTYEPVAALDREDLETEALETEWLQEIPRPEVLKMEVDPLQLISQADSRSTPTDFAPPLVRGSATFAGLLSSNAREIVYVIDASGSMIRSMPIVIEELARSLDGLSPEQRFAVIFFQGDEAVMVPPQRLVDATPDATIQALAWINDNIIPGGRTNPVAAIKTALRLEADAIFLLSDNITGSGQFEIDQLDLLELLEQLNPVTTETGRRSTVINCIQFLYPDPLETLKKVAAQHGGPKGYKFLDARELGIAAP
jgi:hypothetical protein